MRFFSTKPVTAAWAPALAWALALALGFGALPQHARAQSPASSFEDDFDDEYKPWREIAVQIPATPEAAKLVDFYLHPASRVRFSIDPKSLSVGSDGVVRYTLVSVSDRGAMTVSYEGLRCDPRQKKLYAFGRPDGSWGRTRRNQWDPVRGDRSSHEAMLVAAACDFRSVIKDPAEILKRLRAKPQFEP